MWDFRCPHFATAIGNSCVVGAPWDTAPARGLVWGDSHTSHLLPYLDVAGRQTNRAIVVLNGCTPPLGGRVKSVADMDLQRPEVCAADRAAGINLLKRFPEIEFVIFASRWPGFLDQLQTDNDPQPRSIAHGLDLIGEEMQATIAEIRSMGRQILLVEGVPVFDFDPIPCASAKDTPLWRNTKRVCAIPIESIPLSSTADQAAVSRVYDELASNNDGVFSISLSRAMCSNGNCLTYLDGEFLYRDGHHLRRDLSPELNAKLSGLLGLDKALARLGGNALNLTAIPSDICIRDTKAAVHPHVGFSRLSGNAFLWPLPELSASADGTADNNKSPFLLCEGDKLLGPAHSPHADIIAKGMGQFSHYGGGVIFSASDNSDPNSNGRSYFLTIPPTRAAPPKT